MANLTELPDTAEMAEMRRQLAGTSYEDHFLQVLFDDEMFVQLQLGSQEY